MSFWRPTQRVPDCLPVFGLCCPKDTTPQIANVPVGAPPVDGAPVGLFRRSVCSCLHLTFPAVCVRYIVLWVTHHVHVSILSRVPSGWGIALSRPEGTRVMNSRCLSAGHPLGRHSLLGRSCPTGGSAFLTVCSPPNRPSPDSIGGFHVPHR